MGTNEIISGYLDVKISSKSRRGLTPWKAWQKQWCEIRRLDTLENGIELKLKSSKEGSVLNCVILPRSSTICRTESRTKQYAFGVFNLGKHKKPILFMSGVSESDSQEWILSLRRLLCIASYLPVGESTFRVSLIDNSHSRSAGLVGLFGVLSVTAQEIAINDPCTGDPKLSWKKFYFHQFHIQASPQIADEKKILVMHTSREFPAGPGQLLLYCKEGPQLLEHLVLRGKMFKTAQGITSTKRLSRSEGDLCCCLTNAHICALEGPSCSRVQPKPEDSGVRVSVSSDDSGYTLKSKNTSSLQSIGLALITKTPGGSETEDSAQDLTSIQEKPTGGLLPRRESGLSLASGIYEEIPDEPPKEPQRQNKNGYLTHVYENPLDMILDDKKGKRFTPPPLPPRRKKFPSEGDQRHSHYGIRSLLLPFKHRCNTLPAKDLSKLSQIFTAESDYVVMSPSKTLLLPRKAPVAVMEDFYMPMSSVMHLKNELVESCYMSMTAKRKA